MALFFVQEVFFRLLFPLPEISNFDRSQYLDLPKSSKGMAFLRDQDWYWESEIDTSAIFVHGMNRYGFRGQEWEIEKNTDQTRIFFVGDSFVEGVMTSDDWTFPVQFERCASDLNVEVFNAGMTGLAPKAYMQFLSDAVPIFRPDVVFLCFYANDLGKYAPVIPTNFLAPEYFHPLVPRVVELFRQAFSHGPVFLRWSFNSHPLLPSSDDANSPWKEHYNDLSPHVSDKVKRAMVRGTHNPFRTNSFIKEERFLKSPSQVWSYIDYFRFLSDNYDFVPVVVYLPSRNQVSSYYRQFERESSLVNFSDTMDLRKPRYKRHQNEISEICRNMHMSFIDMTSTVESKENSGAHLYWNYDEHFRSEGYELVGKELCKEFRHNIRSLIR